ncbi:hypothetical protein NWF32_02105 [Pseudomonas qingdaonensis]|nr:hypothetical protein [Pseudomonas qingdaonensis]
MVTLVKSKQREVLDWVSLGINLIGVLPAPPTMAAARMSLRPTLFLVRQELRNSAKMLLGDSLIQVLIGHLNATIAGTIDDFVTQAKPRLAEILTRRVRRAPRCSAKSPTAWTPWPPASSMPGATARR